MEQLYRCRYTGQIFDSEWKCFKSEFENGDEHNKFLKLVETFIYTIERKFRLKVDRKTLKVHDYLHENYDISLDHTRELEFYFSTNGKDRIKYFKESDPVGDGRWEWGCEDNLDSLVRDFEKTYLLPRRKKFEGRLKREWNSHEHYKTIREHDIFLGDKNIIDILFAIKDGKKVRIEIIE
jgi:hypothetical protein